MNAALVPAFLFSEELLRLAPSRCNVAYDILVFVGEALFRRHQTTQEVCAELIARNVQISNSEVAYLGAAVFAGMVKMHLRLWPRLSRPLQPLRTPNSCPLPQLIHWPFEFFRASTAGTATASLSIVRLLYSQSA